MKQLRIPEATPKGKAALLILAILLLVSINASSQAYTVLYKFQNNGIDPQFPSWTGLFAQGRDGNLYSTSQAGGKYTYGTVFQLTPAGKMTVLHPFALNDGTHPASGLTLGTDGNLYGAGSGAGACCGTVFKISTGGASRYSTVLTAALKAHYPKLLRSKAQTGTSTARPGMARVARVAWCTR
jgi:uncharacterized repeat protein (TIGR03803 family)